MDFKNIVNQIAETDPEFFERISPRRKILQSFGSKVAVAAIPFALGALFNKAYGKTTNAATDALNFALELEYLEYNFYQTAINVSGLIPSADLGGFDKIRIHENQHVDFLKTALTGAGVVPYTPTVNYSGSDYTPNSYDFTAGGLLPDYFGTKDYATFLVVSQTFEDTGVRAYKGQAGNLQSTPYLLPALQIHSAEARHAAHVRKLRRALGATANKPWITGNMAPAPVVQGNYNGEDNVAQGGVTITSLSGVNGNVSMNAATESFDEPLDKTTVAGLVAPFIR